MLKGFKDRKRVMIANIITVSRIILSLLLLVPTADSRLFAALYLLCGISDVLDGYIARKLHTQSARGARLDSAADMVFTAVYALRILPLLSIPSWMWIWTGLIAVAKLAGIFMASKKRNALFVSHGITNRLTGILAFLLPLSIRAVDAKYGAFPVCVAASLSVVEDMINLKDEENK